MTGSSATVVLVVTATAPGALYSPFNVGADQADPDVSNNRARVRIAATVPAPESAAGTANVAFTVSRKGLLARFSAVGVRSGAARSATAKRYRWSFGDGARSTIGPRVSHRYPKAGRYVVRLTVTDGSGVKRSAARAVRLFPAA